MRDYPKITKKLMHQKYSELDPDFMCFDDYYEALSKVLPKDMYIFDIGCYMAAQGYFFKDHERYFGVDIVPEFPSTEDSFYVERFRFRNSHHYTMSAQDFFQNELKPTLENWGLDDTSNCFFICSAVPDKEVQELVKKMPNCLVWYPGKGTTLKLDGLKNEPVLCNRIKRAIDEASKKKMERRAELNGGEIPDNLSQSITI